MVTATDLNQAMLDQAASRIADDRVRWQQADAQALPFPDASFDLVVCSFGVMFMPDKPAAYREARRVLRPSGRFLLTVWDRLDANPLSHIVNEAVGAMFPIDPPQFMARTPFGHSDKARLEADLRGAGFVDVTIEEVTRESDLDSADGPAMGLTQGTPLRARSSGGTPPASPRRPGPPPTPCAVATAPAPSRPPSRPWSSLPPADPSRVRLNPPGAPGATASSQEPVGRASARHDGRPRAMAGTLPIRKGQPVLNNEQGGRSARHRSPTPGARISRAPRGRRRNRTFPPRLSLRPLGRTQMKKILTRLAYLYILKRLSKRR
jgi:hypothetical protein